MKNFLLIFILSFVALLPMGKFMIFDKYVSKLDVCRTYEYSYMPTDDSLKCGSFYISTDISTFLQFGKSVLINKSINLDEIFDTNNISVVSCDIVLDKNVYLLYCDELPKFKIFDGHKYNIQVVISSNDTKIGYPSIFDSF